MLLYSFLAENDPDTVSLFNEIKKLSKNVFRLKWQFYNDKEHKQAIKYIFNLNYLYHYECTFGRTLTT